MKTLFICLSMIVSATASAQDEVNKGKVTEYLQNEQYKEVVDYLTPSIKDSQDIFILNTIGYAHISMERFAEAEVFYNKTITVDSTNFTANKYLAQIERERENYQQAVFYHKRMMQVQPQNASVFKSTGDLYQLLKEMDSSMVYYQKAYLLQPLNIRYAANYVTQLLNQKKYKTADSIINNFLSVDSNNVPATMLAIRSAYDKQDYKTASAFSAKWLNTKLDDLNIPTTVRLAIANYELKNFLMSHKLCDTVIKQGLQEEKLMYHSARALNKLGRHKESNDLLNQCLDLAISGDAEKYLFEKSDNFESLKQYNAAVAACDTAYFLFQKPLALYNIGRLYETRLNNKSKAISYYKRYVEKGMPTNLEEIKVYAYLKEMLTPKTTK